MLWTRFDLDRRATRSFPFAPECPVGLVDGLNQSLETGSFVDRPGPAEALAKQFQLMFGKQPNSHDAVGQRDSPRGFDYEERTGGAAVP